MRLYGLIGFPLGHSFSKKYFTEKFERQGIPDAHYELFPMESLNELPALLAKHPELCGLNVTIPHKIQVIQHLEALHTSATTVGAVNCIDIRNGRLTGYNTDVEGFRQSLETRMATLEIKPKQALILGAGGAAKAVASVLSQLKIPFQYVSRNAHHEAHLTYEQANKWLSDTAESPRLLVNATPVGAWPDTEACPPIAVEYFGQYDLVFDLIYNPAETLLLRKARQNGAYTQNGLEMLYLQAEAAWQIWNSTQAAV